MRGRPRVWDRQFLSWLVLHIPFPPTLVHRLWGMAGCIGQSGRPGQATSDSLSTREVLIQAIHAKAFAPRATACCS